MMNKPFFITLTGPSTSGKSFLLNYIRDVARLPCLVSTTTRAPRLGEKEGKDYYFINNEESDYLEKNNLFAECVKYKNATYGVTKTELSEKLSKGITFLIIEPSGISDYVKPIAENGAYHLSYYIHSPLDVRIDRFKQRIIQSIDESETYEHLQKAVDTNVNRLVSMLTEEMRWFTAHGWHRVLFGTEHPENNLAIILNDVEKIKKS
jgi:guanylate kinase